MMTFRLFEKKMETLPMTVSWYLADLGEARGKQELFNRQSPQRLKVLREHALIESTVSSNRIEGIEIDQSRMVRRVLRDLQKSGTVECLGRGPGAAWRKKEGNTLEKG